MKEGLLALKRYALRGIMPVQGAQTGSTDSAGGFSVGEELNAVLAGYADEGSAMRRVCNPTRVETGAPVPFGILDALPSAQFRDEGEQADTNATINVSGGTLKFATLTSKILAVSRELLQDSGVDLEAELLEPLGIAWGQVANFAYTRTQAEAPNIQGITESAILADYHATETIVGEESLLALQEVRRALPRGLRSGATWMGSETARDGMEAANARRYPGVQVPIEVNEDLNGVLSINANGYDVGAATAKTTLLHGNFSRFYRIFDVGNFAVERFDDADYLSKSLVGLRVKMRTTGRLIGPARCVVYAS